MQCVSVRMMTNCQIQQTASSTGAVSSIHLLTNLMPVMRHFCCAKCPWRGTTVHRRVKTFVKSLSSQLYSVIHSIAIYFDACGARARITCMAKHALYFDVYMGGQQESSHLYKATTISRLMLIDLARKFSFSISLRTENFCLTRTHRRYI